ncbi:UNVERIFIED_CONTAM: hypothetical protein Slati_0521500 [Sesamum latifolium]|uniref:DUF4283 domain-containing protein n=1 Tax=Sesamum latifolium TaxID=2727402 RepID=A0AAW2XYU2_9LAMI
MWCFVATSLDTRFYWEVALRLIPYSPSLCVLFFSICLRDDEKAGMLMPDGLWNSNRESFHLCLVRRLSANHSYNFDGFCASIKSMLMAVKGVDIKQLREDRLLFKFNHIIDRDCALKGCPWSFDNHVLILNDI